MPLAIVRLAAGEKPTEDGWYVVKPPNCRKSTIVHFDALGAEFRARRYGGPDPLVDYTFIARIFPELIEPEDSLAKDGKAG